MNETPINTTTNRLGAGVSEEQVLDAVVRSGYPLQTVIGDVLRAKSFSRNEKFTIQEEWSFIDRDTKELRTLDLLAELRLHDWNPQPRVRPQLCLLIECKQSQLPYVFFQTSSKPHLFNFPMVAGLRSDKIAITTDDDPSTWTLSVINVLDLERDPFQFTPPFCHTLSKCVRKGSDLELSGSDAYNGLVLPLVKALQHYAIAHTPVDTAWYYDCNFTVAVAILDAPMIGVSVEQSEPILSMLPWVRVLRHEYLEDAERFERDRHWVLDVVHKDFFSDYLDKHLIPFVERSAERVLRHTTELATGSAFVPRMGANGWGTFEVRMKPRSTVSRVARATAVGRNILKQFTRRTEDK